MKKQTSIASLKQGSRCHSVPLWVFVCTFLVWGVTTTAYVGGNSSSRFTARTEQDLTGYRALRRMHAKSDRMNHEGWLEAWTELDNQGFRYEITTERGSEYLRSKVLRTMLKREQDLIGAGQADRVALTEENYQFSGEELADDGSRHVLIKPRRKEVTLVDGRMVLSPEGSLLRVEGRLAKNPSFWTSSVNVTRHFATIEGVRVPVATETIAKVKLAGQSRLEISYEYESINGRPVTVADRQTLASAHPRTVPE
jgi:hypothetical protein